MNQDPTLPITISYIISKNLTKMLVITTINMSKQLEELKANPNFYNITILLQLEKEKIVSIDRIKCETLYKGSVLSIYIVENRDESS
jgi:uncharacterized protein (UPF0333 family)